MNIYAPIIARNVITGMLTLIKQSEVLSKKFEDNSFLISKDLDKHRAFIEDMSDLLSQSAQMAKVDNEVGKNTFI